MSTLLISAAGVAKSYAAKKAMDYAGKGLWKYFFFRDYKARLNSVIVEAIREFEKSNPRPEGEKLPFYCFQIFFESLTTYVFFKKGSIKDVRDEMKRDSRIIIPTQEQLDEFYSLLYKKIENDKKLKNAYTEENYKEQIFNISEKLIEIYEVVIGSDKKNDEILEILKRDILTEDDVVSAMNKQVSTQLRIQINSGKYLRDTFIETGNFKDNLRYLSDPIFYSEKIFEEIVNLDFKRLNELLEKKNEEGFSLDIDSYLSENKLDEISKIDKTLSDINDILNKKKQTVINKKFGSGYELKIRDSSDDVLFLKSKVALITESAGQGKTNFLCDFVENFLLNRKIPLVFLTGSEIRPDDIRKSILNKVFPEKGNIEFSDFLKVIKDVCYREKKIFVIVIDGINENINPKELSKSLETFIIETLNHDFIRVVISCRSEYYKDNFSNLEKSDFSENLRIIDSLSRRNHDENIKNKLLAIYLENFNIGCRSINLDVKDQLTSNFLLLRIFCETFEDQDIDDVVNIYKEELFEHYYNKKTDEINKRLENDEFNLKGNLDIKKFINKIIEIMLSQKKYINIPLDDVIEDETTRSVLIRFLDENILVKRDVNPGGEIFTDSQVVNFTFDEFRDFLISRYLIDVIYKKDPKGFESFLNTGLTKESPLMEGCSTFLFYRFRKSNDPELNKIIYKQEWFESVFCRCIFNLKDTEITEEDKKLLSSIWQSNSEIKKTIILNLLNRRNLDIYKNLNITFLFEVLLTFNQEQYENNFVNEFGESHYRRNKIDQERIIEFIEKELDMIDSELEDDEEYKDNHIFELLIYLFTNNYSWEIVSLYERYYFRFTEIANAQLIRALKTKNENLKEAITNFIEEYDIEL